MNALPVYLSVAHLLFEQEYGLKKTQLVELHRKIPELRCLLSCVVCLNLVVDPFKPTTGRCQHNVCRLCVRGRKQLQPECGNCNERRDFKTYIENRKLACLLLCYKSLCVNLKRSGVYYSLSVFRPSIRENGGGGGRFGGLPMPKKNVQEIILEGARYDDMWSKFTDELPLPFRLQKKLSENELITRETEAGDFRTSMSMYDNSMEQEEEVEMEDEEEEEEETVDEIDDVVEEEVIEELTEYTPDDLHDMDFELIDVQEEEVEESVYMPTTTISMGEAVTAATSTTTYVPMHTTRVPIVSSNMPTVTEVHVKGVTMSQEQQSAATVCEPQQTRQHTNWQDMVNLSAAAVPMNNINNLPPTSGVAISSINGMAQNDETNASSFKPQVKAPIGAIATMNTCDMPFIKRHLRIMPNAGNTGYVQATEMPVVATPMPTAATTTVTLMSNSCTVVTTTTTMADIVNTNALQRNNCDKSTLMITPKVQVMNTGVQTSFTTPTPTPTEKPINSGGAGNNVMKRRRDSVSVSESSDTEQVETSTAVSTAPRTRFRSKAIKLDEARSLAVATSEDSQSPIKSCDNNNQETTPKMAMPTNKRKCRCGLTSRRSNSTCFRRRCFCYRNNLPCIDCGCKGCCNPYRADGTRVTSTTNSNSTSPISSSNMHRQSQLLTTQSPSSGVSTTTTLNLLSLGNVTKLTQIPKSGQLSRFPKVYIEQPNGGGYVLAHLYTDCGEAVHPEDLGLPLIDVQLTHNGVISTAKTYVVPLGTKLVPINRRRMNFMGSDPKVVVTTAADDVIRNASTTTITNTAMRTTPQTRHTAKKMQMLKMNNINNSAPAAPPTALPGLLSPHNTYSNDYATEVSFRQHSHADVQLPATPENDEHDVHVLSHDPNDDLDLLQSVGFMNFV